MNYVEFTEFLVASIVQDSNSVKVEESVEDDIIFLDVYVSSEDIGKVIGKQGKTANAIRNLVQASVFENFKNIKIKFQNYE